jgi:quaternary ammonium compound-resistance protein SugE
MAWITLVVAGLFEIGWAIGLKYTHGFTRVWPTIGTAAALVASMALLGIAVRTLPIGTAYAVWTGIGAAGTALLGLWLFDEPATAARLFCIALMVAGVLGLKAASLGDAVQRLTKNAAQASDRVGGWGPPNRVPQTVSRSGVFPACGRRFSEPMELVVAGCRIRNASVEAPLKSRLYSSVPRMITAAIEK